MDSLIVLILAISFTITSVVGFLEHSIPQNTYAILGISAAIFSFGDFITGFCKEIFIVLRLYMSLILQKLLVKTNLRIADKYAKYKKANHLFSMFKIGIRVLKSLNRGIAKSLNKEKNKTIGRIFYLLAMLFLFTTLLSNTQISNTLVDISNDANILAIGFFFFNMYSKIENDHWTEKLKKKNNAIVHMTEETDQRIKDVIDKLKNRRNISK